MEQTNGNVGLSIGELRLDDLEARARAANGGEPLPLKEWVALAESWHIARALHDCRGNRSAAARTLGIGRRTLYAKIDKLNLTPVWAIPAQSNGRGLDSDRDRLAI